MLRTSLLACSLFVFIAPSPAADFDLYYLGGQSNMEGFGRVDELPDELSGELSGVFIFQSTPKKDQVAATGDGIWAVFRPGHGTGFRCEQGMNRYSDRFGLEVSLAHALKKKHPDRNIAIIKYARNGSSIASQAAANWGCWEPDFNATDGEHRDINQYDHFLATVRHAFADTDLDDDGEPDRLVPKGIAWMQGESDATNEATSQQYEANLKRLVDLFRAALRVDDLPVVIGRISDSGNAPEGTVWKHGEAVRAAQQTVAEHDVNAVLVTSTDEYDYSDPWHYDSTGYVDLGRKFAEAFDQFSK